jgi:hypothetical protein
MFVARQIAVASVLAAAPNTALPSVHLFSPITSVTVERIDVGAKSIQIEPLLSRLELTLKGGGVRGLQGKSRLCPTLITNSDSPALSCTTQRFSATLDPKSGAVTLVALRGLPWHLDADGPPRWSYDPDVLTRPLTCPGATAAAKAECSFQTGQLDRAFEELSALKDGSSRGFAALRQGDIALALDDPERALAAFDEASTPSSPVASLATLRRCELIGDCTPVMLEPRTYPEVLRPEAQLRIARELAFHGKWGEVVELLSETARTKPANENNRAEQLRLQRRLLIGALTVPSALDGAETAKARTDDDRLTQALELYLKDPDRLAGRDAEDLTDAAAEAAAHLGSPRFGAHILAAIFPEVAAKHRGSHLLRTAELYLDDDDAAHAEAILEFARTRLPASALRAPRWRQVAKRLKQPEDHVRADEALTERLKNDVELSREISEAMRVSSTARQPPEGKP